MRKLVSLLAVAATAILAANAFAATKTVKVGDDFFKASKITISKGTKVKWTWVGSAPHNVTVTKGPVKFHSTTKTSGTYAKKFTKKGTYTILCTVHAPGMKMTVRVK